MAADPAFADFSGVFERFQSAEALLNPVAEASTTEAKAKPAAAADAADAEGEGEAGEEKMSRKKSRKLKRLSVAELKQLVEMAPKEGSVYFVLGKVYKKRGDQSKAMVHLTRALDLSPKSI